MTKHREKK